MGIDDARRIAEQYLQTFPPAVPDAVLVGVEEHPQAFVCTWTTARHQASGDIADAQGPGVGPLAVPKDGTAPRYLGSQRLDVALHQAGLGPQPAADSGADSWGF